MKMISNGIMLMLFIKTNKFLFLEKIIDERLENDMRQELKMKVDTKQIEWLLNNVTQYRINKDTRVNLSILGRLVRGERKIENLTIKTGSVLTEYAEKLQKQE